MEARYLKNANTYQEVIDVEIPASTRSYQPVSNKDLIDNLKIVVDHYGMKVTKEYYELGRKGNQVFGAFTISDKDEEMQKCIGFRNSYDKSLPIGFVSGAEVIVCSNLMFNGEIKKVRKHTVNIFHDLQEIMEESVKYIGDSFNQLVEERERLKKGIVTL